MSTYPLSPNDRTADDFELPPLPRFVDYDEFVAKWEEEGQQTRCRLLRLGLSQAAKGACFDLEFDQWLVADRQWTESVNSLHKLCQEWQIASPLDGKVCLQTETAVRWVERDAYEHNPQQWDRDGKVWVRTAVVL